MNAGDFCQYQNVDLETKPVDHDRLERQILAIADAIELVMEQLARMKRNVDALRNKDEK